MPDALPWSPADPLPPRPTSGPPGVLGRGILRTGPGLAAFLALPGGGAGEIPGPETLVLSPLDAPADARVPALDVLVNNAGILSGGAGGARALSADSHELVFQVNYRLRRLSRELTGVD
jgi:hypothetical protein